MLVYLVDVTFLRVTLPDISVVTRSFLWGEEAMNRLAFGKHRAVPREACSRCGDAESCEVLGYKRR